MPPRAARRRTVTLAATASVLAALGLASPAVAAAAPSQGPFASAEEATIMPGAHMITPITEEDASGCTAAFVFASDDTVYLGYAAHCAGNGLMGMSGCEEPSLPLGSPVVIEGRDGERTGGRLAYSSWLTMQELGETDDALCYLNDFALVELAAQDIGSVNPSVPEIGGPTGIDEDGTEAGEPVISYQPNNPGDHIKDGTSLGDQGDGLTHRLSTDPPGRPGDSGAGYLDGDGEAFAILSTQLTSGERTTNGAADLALALEYANDHGGIGEVALVPGTEPFVPIDSDDDVVRAAAAG